MVGRNIACRRIGTRVLALLLASTAFVQQAISAPSDIFTTSAPVIGASAPKGREVKDGDASVATQTGALNYTYPIQVPPGRNGLAPQLALTYTSQGAANGTIAAGWSLPIPEIREDVSQGRLATRAPTILFGDLRADDRFTSSLAGHARLVKVPIAGATDVYGTYLAQGDTSGARYERLEPGNGAFWRVLALDGTTMLFGEPARTNGSGVGGNPCANVSENYAPLTTVRDAFNNEVRYEYAQGMPNECVLKRISWGYNVPANLTQSFAKVELTYQETPRCAVGEVSYTGAQLDYRTGAKILTGASKLVEIRATAFPFGGDLNPTHTRVVELGYWDAASNNNLERCDLLHASVRLLRSIQERAWRANEPVATLPAVTFDYGSPAVVLNQGGAVESTPWTNNFAARGGTPDNFGWGRRTDSTSATDHWPTVEAMMLDVDGDGLPDRVTNTSKDTNGSGECRMSWQRNPGPELGTPNATPQFSGGVSDIVLPRLRWHKDTGATGAPFANFITPDYEHCALNGQVTAYRNVPGNTTARCHDESNCQFSSTPGLQGSQFCYSPDEFGLECPGLATVPGTYRTYLAYRWLDVTADGLPDLVAAVYGDIRAYDIIRGTDGTQNPDATPFGVPWPACPQQMDHCKDVSRDCLAAANTWSAIVACFDSVPAKACHELATSVYSIPGGLQPPSMQRKPYQRCEGLYPWIIYPNRGGTFATEPVIKYSPVPLESNTGDSNIGGPSITSAEHMISDLDGDGVLDVATIKQGTQAWQVWRGDGTGGFAPTRYTMLPHSAQNAFFANDAPNTQYGAQIQTAAGLVDLNGDGLSEHWLLGFSSTNVCWANGTSFETIQNGGNVIGTVDIAQKPGEDTTFAVSQWNWNHTVIEAGTMTSKRRIVDVDHDGRVDLVDLAAPLNPLVRFNAGAEFLGLVGYPGYPAGALHKVLSSADANRTWEVLGELIDLDGDGIAESATMEGGFSRSYHASPSGPPRLLTTIKNGRGATTTIGYASMHDESAVKQRPDLFWPDGRPKASPSNQWVVKTLTTSDAFSNTSSMTSQYYMHPRHGANDEGRYAFRGFEEVRTSTAAGAQMIELFDYMTDWSGRLVETRVHPTVGATEVRAIDRAQWTPRTLFAGAHTAHHATMREHFTCANAQTVESCTAAAAPAYTNTVITQTAFNNSAGQPVLWADMESVLQAGATLANGDRRTHSTFTLSSNTTQHRFRPLTKTREHRVAGAWTMFGKTAKTWDATLRALLTEEVWFNANDAERAITRFEHDITTGNVLRRWKPVQNETTNGTFLEFVYDDRKLFATIESNELRHVRYYTFEYGTGTKILTTGPNVSTCGGGCPPGAPPGSICLPSEQYETKIDGLGRPLEQWDTVSDDGCTFYSHKRATTSYADAVVFPSPTTPNSVTEKVRIDSEASTWTEKRTDLDGLGRPIKETVFVQGTAPADQVSTFTYSSAGTLTAVEVPDPNANSAARVQYLYTYDTLNRPLTIRRPDSTTNKSGADISYDGVTNTKTEVVGASGGNAAGTKTISDRFGRLVQVQEQAGASTWQTTTYAYGPDDLVTSIVDPQSVTTSLAHDFAGRRTQITRGTRNWRYTYTKNGNLWTEQVPGSTGPGDDINYTTSIAYDDLDRPLQKITGQRSLSAPDQAAFGTAKEDFFYDLGGNMLGKLRYWYTYAPGSSTAAVSRDLRITTQGQTFATTDVLNVAGYPTLSRGFYQNFYLFGGVRGTNYYDAVGAGTQETYTQHFYDARGLPSSIFLSRGAAYPTHTIAVQTRNVAGLVTKRRSTLVAGGTNYIESNWTYDALGRVTSQIVTKGPTSSQVARQNLAYFGNDNPKQVNHILVLDSKAINYTYDRRHQLLTAISTTTGYFSGTYAYGNAGRLSSANEAQTIIPRPAGSKVQDRNINYVYGGSDPEQVTALTNVSDGTTYASFTYDAAGNMTAKCTGGQIATCTGASMEKLEYVYDGKDQLRRVTRRFAGAVTGTEEYWYGLSGDRVAIVKRNASGAKTEMVWFIGDTQAHYDANGTVTHVYSNVSLGTPVARIDRTADTVTSMEYQFHGLANSTLATVADSGTINTSFRYSPWGAAVESTNAGGASNGTAAHRRRHNDKYVDEVSNLAYYGARYYDKTLIGWTQEDPLYALMPDLAQMSSPRRANVYSYTLQNPLAYLDPDGRDSGKWGSDQFVARCDAESVCGAGAAIEGRWSGVGETSTTALRAMIVGGIAKQRQAKAKPRIVASLNWKFVNDLGEWLEDWFVPDYSEWALTKDLITAGSFVFGGSPLITAAIMMSVSSTNENDVAMPMLGAGCSLVCRAASTVPTKSTTLATHMGSAQVAETVKLVLKSKLPLSSLTAAQRTQAASWYRMTSNRVGNELKNAASKFNEARAQYLDGSRPSIQSNIYTFIKETSAK